MPIALSYFFRILIQSSTGKWGDEKFRGREYPEFLLYPVNFLSSNSPQAAPTLWPRVGNIPEMRALPSCQLLSGVPFHLVDGAFLPCLILLDLAFCL